VLPSTTTTRGCIAQTTTADGVGTRSRSSRQPRSSRGTRTRTRPDDDGARTQQATHQYARDFDSVVAAGKCGAEVVDAMTEKYPELEDP